MAENPETLTGSQTIVSGRIFPPGTFVLDFRAKIQAVVTEEKGGGYSARVPALPGCFTEGETIEDLEVNLREAAELWMETYLDDVMIAAVARQIVEGAGGTP